MPIRTTVLKDRLKIYARAATWYLGTESVASIAAFKDVRVRQAIAYAIDKKAIVDNVLSWGQPRSRAAFVPEGIFSYDPTYQRTCPTTPRSPKNLLADAGLHKRCRFEPASDHSFLSGSQKR